MDIDLSTGTGAASGRGEFGAYSDDEENESNVSDAAADAHDDDYDDHEEEEKEEHIHREEGEILLVFSYKVCLYILDMII